MSLSREELQGIALLARIGLTDEELARIGKDLGSILGYVDRLGKIDTRSVPEAAPKLVRAVDFRVDEENGCTESEQALIIDNFPATTKGMLKAPAVFEKPKQ